MRIAHHTFMQILKKPFLLLLLLFLPAAAIYGLSEFTGNVEEDLSVPVAIVDQDRTDFSKTFINRLEKQERIKLSQTTEADAKDLLLREETDTVFIIKEGFKQSIRDGEREGIIEMRTSPLSVASGVVREIAASEVIRFTSSAKAANRVEKIARKYEGNFSAIEGIWQEAYQYADQQWEPKPLMTIRYVPAEKEKSAEMESDSGSGLLESPARIWTIAALLLCMFTCDWIPKEKDVLYKRIQTTPAGLNAYIVQSFIAYLALNVIQAAVSWWMIGRLESGTSITLLIPMVIFMMLGLSVSFFLASISPHTGNYYTASTVWIFTVSLLGGSVVPAGEILPQLKNLQEWLPQAPVLNWDLYSGSIWLKLVLTSALSSILIFISMSRLRSTR
ncbi:ABC transporter permease [Metabacillus sp. FJAT-52054]|uniref:ABC transporter permease n=1 Tax=Metabacillus sediminis TaxID=3117746 RepID=A0ABZ2NGF0_9BACI